MRSARYKKERGACYVAFLIAQFAKPPYGTLQWNLRPRIPPSCSRKPWSVRSLQQLQPPASRCFDLPYESTDTALALLHSPSSAHIINRYINRHVNTDITTSINIILVDPS